MCQRDHKYLANITDNSVITCDEIIDAEETKQLQQISMKKSSLYNTKLLYFTCTFIN